MYEIKSVELASLRKDALHSKVKNVISTTIYREQESNSTSGYKDIKPDMETSPQMLMNDK